MNQYFNPKFSILIGLIFTLFSYSAVSAPIIKKQKKCIILISDGGSLEKGRDYLGKKDSSKIRFKVLKVSKSLAKAKIYRRGCKVKAEGFEVFTLKGESIGDFAVSASGDKNFEIKAKGGAMMTSVPFNANTNISVGLTDLGISGHYILPVGSFKMPIGAGLSTSLVSGDFKDDNGLINISGTIIGITADVGFVYPNIISNLNIGVTAGADIGVSSSVEAIFSSDDSFVAGHFPGDFNDADGVPLGESISAVGSPGFGFYVLTEASYKILDFLGIGGYLGYKQVGNSIVFEQKQPFENSVSNTALADTFEGQAMSGLIFGASASYYF